MNSVLRERWSPEAAERHEREAEHQHVPRHHDLQLSGCRAERRLDRGEGDVDLALVEDRERGDRDAHPERTPALAVVERDAGGGGRGHRDQGMPAGGRTAPRFEARPLADTLVGWNPDRTGEAHWPPPRRSRCHVAGRGRRRRRGGCRRGRRRPRARRGDRRADNASEDPKGVHPRRVDAHRPRPGASTRHPPPSSSCTASAWAARCSPTCPSGSSPTRSSSRSICRATATRPAAAHARDRADGRPRRLPLRHLGRGGDPARALDGHAGRHRGGGAPPDTVARLVLVAPTVDRHHRRALVRIMASRARPLRVARSCCSGHAVPARGAELRPQDALMLVHRPEDAYPRVAAPTSRSAASSTSWCRSRGSTRSSPRSPMQPRSSSRPPS